MSKNSQFYEKRLGDASFVQAWTNGHFTSSLPLRPKLQFIQKWKLWKLNYLLIFRTSSLIFSPLESNYASYRDWRGATFELANKNKSNQISIFQTNRIRHIIYYYTSAQSPQLSDGSLLQPPRQILLLKFLLSKIFFMLLGKAVGFPQAIQRAT